MKVRGRSFSPNGSSLSQLISYQYYLFFSVPERGVTGSRNSNDILPSAPPPPSLFYENGEKNYVVSKKQQERVINTK